MGGLPNELIPTRSPRATNRGVINRRPHIEHIKWGHRAAWSSFWRWPCFTCYSALKMSFKIHRSAPFSIFTGLTPMDCLRRFAPPTVRRLIVETHLENDPSPNRNFWICQWTPHSYSTYLPILQHLATIKKSTEGHTQPSEYRPPKLWHQRPKNKGHSPNLTMLSWNVRLWPQATVSERGLWAVRMDLIDPLLPCVHLASI